MTQQLGGWQRLWVVVSALLLVITVALTAVLWPSRESGVLTDLNSPECKPWRELPDGFFPDRSPQWKEDCYSLKSFLYYKQVQIRSEGEYSSYLWRARAKAIVVAFVSWAGVAVVIYIVGWAVGWVVKGFRRAA